MGHFRGWGRLNYAIVTKPFENKWRVGSRGVQTGKDRDMEAMCTDLLHFFHKLKMDRKQKCGVRFLRMNSSKVNRMLNAYTKGL
jgi:hypothetical protein